MGTSRLEAIADAGPLIHLTEVGQLNSLKIFSQIHIPDAVWAETVHLGRVKANNLLGLDNVTRHTLSQQEVSTFVVENNFTQLHAGECECLFLCQQIGVYSLLTDDLSVRTATKQINGQPVGSLGIIVRAYKMGHISLEIAEKCLDELYSTSTLFVTKEIINIAVRQLHQQISSAE